MTTLRPCPACRRHVAAADETCPFCAAPVAPARAPSPVGGRLSRAAVFGATLATSACWSSSQPADSQKTNPVETQHQASATTGVIAGRATDPGNGNRFTHATVRLVAPDGTTQTAGTNPSGEYVFKDLPPGDYKIEWVQHPPQRPQEGPPMWVEERVTVQAGQVHRLDIKVHNYRPYEPGMEARPYGAPPARRRIV